MTNATRHAVGGSEDLRESNRKESWMSTCIDGSTYSSKLALLLDIGFVGAVRTALGVQHTKFSRRH